MKKHVLKVVLLLIISSGSIVSHAQSNDSLQVQLSRKWTNAKAYTLKTADLMPAENYGFRAVADLMVLKNNCYI
ncbi:MAG: hypothetical protein ABR503_11280 [Chitinophagaceae bacterium]